MFSRPEIGLAIAGMAVATYITRASGFFLMSRFRPTPRIERFLEAIPGTIIVSILAPIIVYSGTAEKIASATTIVTAYFSKNLALSMAVGIGMVVLFRHII